MGHEIRRPADYCRSQRGANQLAKTSNEGKLKERTLRRSPPLPGGVRRGYLVWTHTRASSPRAGQRLTLGFLRAPDNWESYAIAPRERGAKEKHTTSGRWFVWWINSAAVETVSGALPENRGVKSVYILYSMVQCVKCGFVHDFVNWEKLNIVSINTLTKVYSEVIWFTYPWNGSQIYKNMLYNLGS